MSIRYSFMDNTAYGAEDINYALSRLTTQGVSLFNYSDGDNPLIALNDAVAAIAEPGVEYFNTNACLVTYDSENSQFLIQPGTAFMADGSFITIEDNPYDITDTVNELRKSEEGTLTVYFLRNVSKNCIEIRVTASAPEEENTVSLAQILSDGSVLDLRSFARSKIAPASGNIVTKLSQKAFSVKNSQKGASGLRAEFPGIFEGASYCFYGGIVTKIQRVATTDGSELELTRALYASEDSRIYIAFNMINGKLQLWVYTEAVGTTVYSSNIYVF